MKTKHDLPKEARNPYMGKFIQNGKFIVEIKHDSYIGNCRIRHKKAMQNCFGNASIHASASGITTRTTKITAIAE